jgi:hypothetical protein
MFGLIVEQILGHIPTVIWPLVAGAGLGFALLFRLLGKLPQVKAISFLFRPLGLLAFVGGIFMWGGSGVADIYQAQIKIQQQKDAVAEVKSNDANVQIKTVYVDRIKYVHDVQTKVKTQIVHDAVQIDKSCTLDPAVAKDLNAAAVMGESK